MSQAILRVLKGNSKSRRQEILDPIFLLGFLYILESYEKYSKICLSHNL